MSFQATVGTWFAAHLVSYMPVGARFGVSAEAIPVNLQFETGADLDDIAVELSDGGLIGVQCKTHVALSETPHSPFACVIAQLVSFFIRQRSANANLIEEGRLAAVLAVARDAPASLDNLEQACRYFDHGAHWHEAQGQLNRSQQRALERFATHASAAWPRHASGQPSDQELATLARLFHIVRFDVDIGGADLREAARVVGQGLFGQQESGSGVLPTLLTVVRRLIQTGAPSDRDGMMLALRVRGIEDTRNARFDHDLTRLAEYSNAEIQRLARHTRLSEPDSIPIGRECMPALRDAVSDGSLLVTGEPGAGKTGVLMSLAEGEMAAGGPVVFLSVDRLAGVRIADDLRVELVLEHPLLDVLSAWPGNAPGMLIIDALDASRGGESERVFGNLIEDGLNRLGNRWSIVASIRTFDLRNGKKFRTTFKGTPPAAHFAEEDLNEVRHFCIPRLTEGEIQDVAGANAELGQLLDASPLSLRELLRNVFNLSLAAELLNQGASAEDIRSITTQSELIDRYEDERLSTAQLQNAVSDVVTAMVQRRRMIVRKVQVANDAIDDVLNTGLIVPVGDRVAFVHHVLFDHAAGRFYLEWDDPDHLLTQISQGSAFGLLLAPGLRFAMGKLWRNDDGARSKTWRLLAAIGARDDIDPVVATVAFRTAAESVAEAHDISGLCRLVGQSPVASGIHEVLPRLASFVSMSVTEADSISRPAAIAWVTVAATTVAARDLRSVDGARLLLWSLLEYADFTHEEFAAAFGEAARALLDFAWSIEAPVPVLASQAIRLVCGSFSTDPERSRTLLEQILEEPRFAAHAHEEAQWLAEGVPVIALDDPAFAARIYEVLFGRPAPQQGHIWMGGRPSRILPLSSTKEQDYEHARWRLKQAFPAFLNAAPDAATCAASSVAVGLDLERLRGELPEVHEIAIGARQLSVIQDYQSLQEWRDYLRGDAGEDILADLAQFLRRCPAESFRRVVMTAIANETATSVWARILGIGAERVEVAADLLWSVASQPEFCQLLGITRDAVIYLVAAYPSRSQEDRRGFETALLARHTSPDERESQQVWRVVTRFFSSILGETLVTSLARDLKSALEREGRLTGNAPPFSVEVSGGAVDDVAERILTAAGVDLTQGPDRELHAVAQSLADMVRAEPATVDAARVAELWTNVTQVVAQVDDFASADVHAENLHAAWGAVSNAVEIIAKTEHYDPRNQQHPSLTEIMQLLDRMASSPYPEASEEKSDPTLLAWGNWDVRVYVALSLMALVGRFETQDSSIIDRLQAFLCDPVATVRLQVAGSLNVLWHIACASMWQMAESVVRTETHPGVLARFVGGPLLRLCRPAPEHCEHLGALILDRLPNLSSDDDASDGDPLGQAFGHLAAQLWIGQGSPIAHAWILPWTNDLVRGRKYLWPLIATLRNALFQGYSHRTDEAVAIQQRAHGVLDTVIQAANQDLTEVAPRLAAQKGLELEQQKDLSLSRAAHSLLDHACNQLYFGSGAFRSKAKNESPGLCDCDDMQQFLREYTFTLDAIGQVASPRTLYNLIELYVFLVPAAPELVFDRVAAILVGPAFEAGYQFESLASDSLVRFVRGYLADHRSIFDDQQRRARLVDVLELFSTAGWPEALKLLYDLPDLLR